MGGPARLAYHAVPLVGGSWGGVGEPTPPWLTPSDLHHQEGAVVPSLDCPPLENRRKINKDDGRRTRGEDTACEGTCDKPSCEGTCDKPLGYGEHGDNIDSNNKHRLDKGSSLKLNSPQHQKDGSEKLNSPQHQKDGGEKLNSPQHQKDGSEKLNSPQHQKDVSEKLNSPQHQKDGGEKGENYVPEIFHDDLWTREEVKMLHSYASNYRINLNVRQVCKVGSTAVASHADG